MQNRLIRFGALLIAVVFALGLCLTDVNAQKSRRRSRRVPKPVITNPAITPPGDDTGEAKVVSTADEAATESQRTEEQSETNSAAAKKGTNKKATPSQSDQMQQTINSLSTQVEKLTDKLSQIQENDKTLVEMERLTRAEQRAESLRQQQLDVEGKLADMQGRMEQIDYSLKPENIERAAAGYGTVRPEELREARRRQLENEKSRVQAQIRILETSRVRLETALATADAEVDRLRRRLEQRESQENATTSESETRPAATSESESRPATSRKPPE